MKCRSRSVHGCSATIRLFNSCLGRYKTGSSAGTLRPESQGEEEHLHHTKEGGRTTLTVSRLGLVEPQITTS